MIFFGKKTYTEEELVALCAENDRRAQEAFYRRYFPDMMRMCLRYTRDEDRAIVSRQIVDTYQKIQAMEFSTGCGKCQWCEMHGIVAIPADEEEQNDDRNHIVNAATTATHTFPWNSWVA